MKIRFVRIKPPPFGAVQFIAHAAHHDNPRRAENVVMGATQLSARQAGFGDLWSEQPRDRRAHEAVITALDRALTHGAEMLVIDAALRRGLSLKQAIGEMTDGAARNRMSLHVADMKTVTKRRWREWLPALPMLGAFVLASHAAVPTRWRAPHTYLAGEWLHAAVESAQAQAARVAAAYAPLCLILPVLDGPDVDLAIANLTKAIQNKLIEA